MSLNVHLLCLVTDTFIISISLFPLLLASERDTIRGIPIRDLRYMDVCEA